MKVVRNLNVETWRTAVEQNPDGNIFHTPEMYQVFSRTKGHAPECWAVLAQDGQVLALLTPVGITLMDNHWLRRFATRSVAYGGLLAGADDAVRLLLSAYTRQPRISMFTELRHQTETNTHRSAFLAYGFEFEEHQNFLIDLALPVEQVWRNIHKSARKKIRKAQNKNALSIQEVRDRELLPVWYALLQRTYTTVRVPLADFSLFEAAFDILLPKGMVQFLLGRVGDEYVAASVALLYKDTIYGWYRGFDRAFSAYLPNDLMVWHLLKWGAENGYRVFDFGGAGKPGQEYGPRQFKAKFGGRLVSYGRSTCVHHSLTLKLSRVGYHLYRRFVLR